VLPTIGTRKTKGISRPVTLRGFPSCVGHETGLVCKKGFGPGGDFRLNSRTEGARPR
jgi:hypothetical protein